MPNTVAACLPTSFLCMALGLSDITILIGLRAICEMNGIEYAIAARMAAAGQACFAYLHIWIEYLLLFIAVENLCLCTHLN